MNAQARDVVTAKGRPLLRRFGGPDLIGGTARVIAVNSYAANMNCTGTTYSSRVDIPAVLSWIQSFLD